MLTKNEAIYIAENHTYEDTPKQLLAYLQLKTERLFMGFEYFHECVEHALGRPVWTHEFANPPSLIAEWERTTTLRPDVEKYLRTFLGE